MRRARMPPENLGVLGEREVAAWLDQFERLRTECVIQDPAVEGELVDVERFRRMLRLGRFSGLETLCCRPPDIDVTQWNWLFLRRTVALRAEIRHPLADVLAGLA